jgi:hypothetical protein
LKRGSLQGQIFPIALFSYNHTTWTFRYFHRSGSTRSSEPTSGHIIRHIYNGLPDTTNDALGPLYMTLEPGTYSSYPTYAVWPRTWPYRIAIGWRWLPGSQYIRMLAWLCSPTTTIKSCWRGNSGSLQLKSERCTNARVRSDLSTYHYLIERVVLFYPSLLLHIKSEYFYHYHPIGATSSHTQILQYSPSPH